LLCRRLHFSVKIGAFKMKNSLHQKAPRIPLTLAQAIKRYLSEISLLKKGHAAEASIAKQWLSTRLASRPVERVRNTNIIEIRDSWLTSKAASTVTRRLAFLSHVYTVIRKDWGYDWLANPVQLVRRPAVNDARDPRFFDQIRLRGIPESECPRDESAWILKSTRSPEFPTIFIVARETGMRRAEVTGICRENLDLQHGTVRLPHTKNGRSRVVPLTPIAKEALRCWVVGKPMRGRIFTIQPGSVTRAFIRARQRARTKYEELCKKHCRKPNNAYFRDLRFHDTRHEGTSQMATVFQIHELAKVNGNVDTRMLLRYYHPDGRELARKLTRSPLGRKQLLQLRQEHYSPAAASGGSGSTSVVSHAGTSP